MFPGWSVKEGPWFLKSNHDQYLWLWAYLMTFTPFRCVSFGFWRNKTLSLSLDINAVWNTRLRVQWSSEPRGFRATLGVFSEGGQLRSRVIRGHNTVGMLSFRVAHSQGKETGFPYTECPWYRRRKCHRRSAGIALNVLSIFRFVEMSIVEWMKKREKHQSDLRSRLTL